MSPRIKNTICLISSLSFLSLIFAYIAVRSWRRLPDILVDFGRELYTPWQLAEGQVSGIDIAFLFGPFSQYFNAFLFRLFGTAFETLNIANHVLAALVLFSIFLVMLSMSGYLTATVSSMFFLMVFCFARYGPHGSFNFIAPYAHEATHGTLLCFLILSVFVCFGLSRRSLSSFLVGFLFGCALLTKTDIVLGAFTLVVAGLCYLTVIDRLQCGEWGRGFWQCLCLFLLGAFVVPSGFFLFFLSRMTFPQAVDNTLAAVTRFLGGEVRLSSLYFYQRSLGVDRLEENLLLLARVSSLLFVGFFVLAFVDVFLARIRIRDGLYRLLVFSVFLASFFLAESLVPFEFWMDMPRAYPVLIGLSLLVLFWRLFRERDDLDRLKKDFPALLLHVFALVMLSKIIFRGRFFDYGFYLALPASVCFTYILLDVVPRSIQRYHQRAGYLFQAVAVAFLLACMYKHVGYSLAEVRVQTTSVGQGADRIQASAHRIAGRYVGVRGFMTQSAVKQIEQLLPPQATMVVIPEGVILNYFTRRVNPTPFLNFMLVELLVFGEERILESLFETRPDYVILVHKKTEEYGFEMFGIDSRFGKNILDWVYANYLPISRIGYEPFKEKNKFGIQIMRRKVN